MHAMTKTEKVHALKKSVKTSKLGNAISCKLLFCNLRTICYYSASVH